MGLGGVCTGKDLGGAAHRGAGLAEQVEGGASTLAHLGHAEAAAVAPLALEEVDLIGKRQPASEELGCR